MKNKREVIKEKEKKTWKVEEVFEWNGFKCAIILNRLEIVDKKMKKLLTTIPTEWRCGYIGLKKGHTFYRIHYSKFKDKIDVQGDLSFSDFMDDVLPKGLWWIGFACNYGQNNMKYWTKERVKKEVIRLANHFTRRGLILLGLE